MNERHDDLQEIIDAALREMAAEEGDGFDPQACNLAEFCRRTGLTRSRARTVRAHGFRALPHGNSGRRAAPGVLAGHTGLVDDLLRKGVTNSQVIFERLLGQGYAGGLTTVKTYIAAHRDLVPAKRRQAAPQGCRGQRFRTAPGEAYQMDWGFVAVERPGGERARIACFAMVCHHCGGAHVEFFPNARQENLLIGMLHAFSALGVPATVLTDNMKSVVVRRDADGRPVWQADYAEFMGVVGFRTRLCRPRHPYTKGKVERLVRFVKGNFLAGRSFTDLDALNREAALWCAEQGGRWRRAAACVPMREHEAACSANTRPLEVTAEVERYLCPRRKISFDGFVSFEGHRYGVPYWWIGYTDVDSSGRGAGDGRAVYEGPQAPEAFHRRVQEADSRPLQRRQAQARDHGRVRPRQEHRGEVDQVDKRDRLAARRVQPHARAEPDPGARAREPQAPDGGRRLKTSGADIRSKVRAIAANEGRYPISAQCRLLGVARSTYYSMRSRADRPAAPDPAAPAVVAAHAASKGRYGSRKIKASLERSGVTVSRRRVCRIMRENGLVSAYGRKRFKVHPGAVNEADVPNVVARGFGGRAPRTHICSDLTYVRVGASWNYVCLLVDLYNREIVGHSAGPRKDARLVKSAFATLSFPISDIEVFHTDRGSEFDNAEIDLMLEAFGIERSLSAKGCPYDNAVDESTNRILKAELVHRETFGTTRELRAKLSDYVHWYNNFRIHSTLGYMSPVEFREAGLSLPESSK